MLIRRRQFAVLLALGSIGAIACWQFEPQASNNAAARWHTETETLTLRHPLNQGTFPSGRVSTMAAPIDVPTVSDMPSADASSSPVSVAEEVAEPTSQFVPDNATLSRRDGVTMPERYPLPTEPPGEEYRETMPNLFSSQPNGPAADANEVVSHVRHRVQDGDSLRQLALRYLGSSARAQDIFAVNRDLLTRPDLLPLGVELRIPPDVSHVSANEAIAPREANFDESVWEVRSRRETTEYIPPHVSLK